MTHGDETRAAILRFIAAFRAEYACGPTVREIMDHTRLVSTGAVHYQLTQLLDAGLINWHTLPNGRMRGGSVWVTERGRKAVEARA